MPRLPKKVRKAGILVKKVFDTLNTIECKTKYVYADLELINEMLVAEGKPDGVCVGIPDAALVKTVPSFEKAD
jgi:hypothetical protein